MSARRCNLGFAGVLLVLLWGARDWMQARMLRHMLLQLPLLACCGCLLHASICEHLRARLAPWNRFGLTGFVLIQSLAALWMVPRILDIAQVSSSMETVKFIVWILAGFLLRQSMHQSNAIVELFMLGNFAMMTAAISDIYENTPYRLCNAYGRSDQAATAQGLLWLLFAVCTLWTLRAWCLHALATPDPLRFPIVAKLKRAMPYKFQSVSSERYTSWRSF